MAAEGASSSTPVAGDGDGLPWSLFVVFSLCLSSAIAACVEGRVLAVAVIAALGVTSVLRFFWRRWWRPNSHAPATFHHRCGEKLFVEVLDPLTAPLASNSPKGAAKERAFHELRCADVETPTEDVLLIHGMLTSGRYWQRIAREVASRGYRCIMPDLLGFGRSPWPLASSNYTVASHVAHLAEAVARCSSPDRPLHIVGHSLGGVLALELATELATRHGRKVSSVTLLGTPAFRSAADAAEVLATQCVVRAFLGFPCSTWLLCSAMCQQRWLWASPPLVYLWASLFGYPTAVVEDFFLHSWGAATHSVKHCLLQPTLTSTGRLRKLGTRLLVLHGADDNMAPPQLAHDFAGRFGSSWVGLSGVGHSVITHHEAEHTVALAICRHARGEDVSSLSSYTPPPPDAAKVETCRVRARIGGGGPGADSCGAARRGHCSLCACPFKVLVPRGRPSCEPLV